MAVAWPATLPAPIANSVKLHTQKNTRTIEFSAKNRRTTTRASKPPSIVECEISMDSVQLDAFDYFIKFDLSYGAHWIDASWLLPMGFSSHFARFLELPKINKRGGRFTVSCVFEIVLQSVAVQMPNTMAYPASNVQPGPPIPQLDLVATYDASAASVGDVYPRNTRLPDSYGAGFITTNSIAQINYRPDSPPYRAEVVLYNGQPALRGYTENWSYHRYSTSGLNSGVSFAPGKTIVTMEVAMSPLFNVAHINSWGHPRPIVHESSANRAVFTTVFSPVSNTSTTYNIDVYINNVFQPSKSATNININGKIGFGRYGGNGYIYANELMLWSGLNPMTAQQRADLVSYLMTKWLII